MANHNCLSDIKLKVGSNCLRLPTFDTEDVMHVLDVYINCTVNCYTIICFCIKLNFFVLLGICVLSNQVNVLEQNAKVFQIQLLK